MADHKQGEYQEENIKKNMSRRDFIRSAAVGAAGVAAFGILGACGTEAVGDSSAPSSSSPEGLPATPQEPPLNQASGKTWSWETLPNDIPDSQIKETVEADVIVIGTGLAGCCAALSAREKGAKVLCIEKNSKGMFAARGGHTSGFGTRVVKETVGDVDYAQVIRRWIYWAQGRCKEELLWEYARKSGACMDWLFDLIEPYGLRVALWDGYYKGPDYTEIPVTHFFYTENTNFMYQNGVIEGAGQAVLLPVLIEEMEKQGIQFHYDCPSARLLRNADGPVTGVIGGTEETGYIKFVGKSTIIATGDYASDKEMIERYDPFALEADSQVYLPNLCNTGDLHKQTMWIGGAMQKVEPHAAVIHLESGAQSYAFLHVNRMGERFMNEDVNTQSKSCVKEYQYDGTAFTIFDSHGLKQVKQQIDSGIGGGLFWGQTFQRKGVEFDLDMEEDILEICLKAKKPHKADTLEELAQLMEVPQENFLKTIQRYNQLCTLGKDEDFGKRSELLTPIVVGPFYAGKLVSTILTMVGGLRTNTHCQVLDGEDNPVEGLYVCGSAAGDFFANDYPTIVPGIGHGRCICFGRLAGLVAAGGSIDEVPDYPIAIQ